MRQSQQICAAHALFFARTFERHEICLLKQVHSSRRFSCLSNCLNILYTISVTAQPMPPSPPVFLVLQYLVWACWNPFHHRLTSCTRSGTSLCPQTNTCLNAAPRAFDIARMFLQEWRERVVRHVRTRTYGSSMNLNITSDKDFLLVV